MNENFTRIEELGQELSNERKVKESFIEENSVLKSKLDEVSNKLKFEVSSKEEERFRIFEGKKAELQEFAKGQQKKEEDIQRLSQINAEMHRNFLVFKQEKEELQRKLRDCDAKNRELEETQEKSKKKFEDYEARVNEFKEKLQAKNMEINSLKMEQRSSIDASFRIEKENLIKYEEFNQVY